MKYNPALPLKDLIKKINVITSEIDELEENGLDASHKRKELHHLKLKYKKAFTKAYSEYVELFKEYYYTIEDVQHMLDLDIQMAQRRIVKEADCIEFSKIFRHHIKTYRKNKEYDRLSEVANIMGVDIDKKIFISKSSLIKWIENHVTTYDKIPVSTHIAYRLIEDRGVKSVLGTVSFKEKYHLKYDMQVKRLSGERLFFYMRNKNESPRVRFPVDRKLDYELIKLRESITE